jgi:hypothetical protein
MVMRTYIRRIAAFLVAIVIVPPFGQFFISWAEERGWYQNPGAKMSAVIAFFAEIASSPLFHWVGGAIIGFAGGVWLDVLLKRRDEGEGIIQPADKTTAPVTKDDPDILEDFTAFFNSWLKPAAHEVHNAINFLAARMGQEHTPLAGQVGTLAHQAIVDPERAMFAALSNRLSGIDDDQRDLLVIAGDYYRRYQACRTWIAQFAENLHMDVKTYHATSVWLAHDQAFLHELRRLCGQSQFQKLFEQVAPTGWGEGITLRLNEDR